MERWVIAALFIVYPLTDLTSMPEQQKTETISEQIERIKQLCSTLKLAQDLPTKLAIVEGGAATKEYLKTNPLLDHLLGECSLEEQFAVKAVLAIGQGLNIFHGLNTVNNPQEALHGFIQPLLDLEKFYDVIGGVVGYHLQVIQLMLTKQSGVTGKNENVSFEEPEGLDLSQNTIEVRRAVRWGLESMPQLAEIYPVGGAGDRLNLKDEVTGELLPAAQLNFCGRSLLEGLIRDLQGREFLHYKLFGRRLTTPLALMTSHEKHNHERMIEICESQNWFNRPKESFLFFIQPLVPMITKEGQWAMKAPLKPILKPGGHGVIWKVAHEQGVFDKLTQLHCRKALVRQINNPVAGIDNGLLGLSGLGCHADKAFGFASCDRLLNSPEGMDVLYEEKVKDGYKYCITNVEYTEFKKWGIEDISEKPGSPYSRFPSNTNILFVDLATVEEACEHASIPGMLINIKGDVECQSPQGPIKIPAGRLESTMQNIADQIVDTFPQQLQKGDVEKLRTFLTYNTRRKTISVAKQEYVTGKSTEGTPEDCFYELMENYRDLLGNHCHMQLPPSESKAAYYASGPSFVALFHPALGGLYQVIGQKIRGGKIAKGSEFILEIAEADIFNLDLHGSLIVEADQVMGKKDGRDVIFYDSRHCGKCTLHNVTVLNEGSSPVSVHQIWKRQSEQQEALRITLHGNAEFFAENVILEGDVHFDVPNGKRLVVYQQGNEVAWHIENINQSTWEWVYEFDEEENIVLNRTHHH